MTKFSPRSNWMSPKGITLKIAFKQTWLKWLKLWRSLREFLDLLAFSSHLSLSLDLWFNIDLIKGKIEINEAT